jgi:hypothetical protein
MLVAAVGAGIFAGLWQALPHKLCRFRGKTRAPWPVSRHACFLGVRRHFADRGNVTGSQRAGVTGRQLAGDGSRVRIGARGRALTIP